ncbi:unnamed protein product [Soboliphyme baturini]|uniref:S-adenosyl-L-methionine-dependent tRNA 4-demethylwyosine synthase TYW1 n=1 Tax=Soboliphyme baturini TaxID=241478 RepID=A0A183IHP2_9BILA|nr:unnamed protein product [Soboliphyme baturini]
MAILFIAVFLFVVVVYLSVSLTYGKSRLNDAALRLFGIRKLNIFYATNGGIAKKYAVELAVRLKPICTIRLVNLETYDPEDSLQHENDISLFIVSTFINGFPPENCRWFFTWVNDAASDFRYDHHLLHKLKFAVFGIGDSVYGEDYNKVAKSFRNGLLKLEAKEIIPLKLADESCSVDEGGYHSYTWRLISRLFSAGIDESFELWANRLMEYLSRVIDDKNDCQPTSTVVTWGDKETLPSVTVEVTDLEDILLTIPKQGIQLREMITPSLRQSLSKQGYKLIGSHSGVKLCRWTKSMLRGRGGCYKNTFYGINSHQCMEVTPSLACANKCVFCWRHHSNPVGTSWNWKMDDPEFIFQEAIRQHLKIIKENRGLPGVKEDRFEEAHNVKHCALSLVGEPIMFPKINEFVDILHRHGISTFLVTNAQFPEEIRKLQPVTQLYCSIDASTEGSLKQIDRPLFKDFWKRFIDSLTALRDKQQRTVYRLTLVKGYNTSEIEQYAKLVELGSPDFVEVKGVTYCGTSKDSHLTMENVPWHSEVICFGIKLMEHLKDYEIATEHKHSNCILLAKTKYKINGVWHTWIDYAKFQELYQLYVTSGKRFSSMDYIAETPHWALFESEEHGFNPADVRWYRKNRKVVPE